MEKRKEARWLRDFGNNLTRLVSERGYESVYSFWLEKGSESFSRSYLNYVVAGKRNPKATTLVELAELLDVEVTSLFEFKEK